MTTLINPYFNQDKGTEQSLLQGLTSETIKLHGKTYYYLPRTVQVEDLVLGEDVISKFTQSFSIEMYMVHVDGFEGNREMFSKFGLEVHNSYDLVVSKQRWETEVGNNVQNALVSTRPQEGDLIYDPLTSGLFEIKFVDHDYDFYQLDTNYTYTLKCELFQYSSEEITTGNPDVDKFVNNSFNILDFEVQTEDGNILTQENDDSILQEQEPKPERPYGTDFPSQSSDVTIVNPFE